MVHNAAEQIPMQLLFPTCRKLFLLLAVIGWSVSAAPQAQVQSSPGASKEPFVADQRLEIPAIPTTLRVAEPNEIPIVIHGSGLKTILTEQRIEGEDPYGWRAESRRWIFFTMPTATPTSISFRFASAN